MAERETVILRTTKGREIKATPVYPCRVESGKQYAVNSLEDAEEIFEPSEPLERGEGWIVKQEEEENVK